MSQANKERAPARTTPPKRFFCNDCNSKFKARYLANRNTRSTQHWCLVYGKVVTRKVGQKSQKCQCDHEGPCVIERKGPSKPGCESEDEAKANQRKNRGVSGSGGPSGNGTGSGSASLTSNGMLGGSGSNGRPKKSKDGSKKLTNGRSGNKQIKNNNNTNSLTEDNETAKEFEGYLYQSSQSKKRFQRDDDSEDDWDVPDKKRRRKNKSRTESNSNSMNNNGHTSSSMLFGNARIPNSDDEEDDDIGNHSNLNPNSNNNNNNNNNNSNNKNGQFSEYYEQSEATRRPHRMHNRPIRILPNGGVSNVPSVPSVAPIAPVPPPVLSMNEQADESENDNDEIESKYDGDRTLNAEEDDLDDEEEEDSDVGHSSDEPKTVSTIGDNINNNEEVFNSFVQIYNQATQRMQESNYEAALETLMAPIDDDKYVTRLRNHPIMSESYLIMAHAYQALDQAEEALKCLNKIKDGNYEILPLHLKCRIKDTEVQLLQYSQRYDEMRNAEAELARLRRIGGIQTEPY